MSESKSQQSRHTVTRIDVIRHGEPEGGEVFRGRTDHALTDNGRRQFRERLSAHPANWQQVISSPLQRCHESALETVTKLKREGHNIDCTTDERWAEIDYGDWEDCLISDITRAQKTQFRALWEDPMDFCAPGGEPVSALQQRVLAAWTSLLENHAGQHVLVVSHGGVMRVLAQHLLMLAPEAMNRLGIPFAGMLRFRVDQMPGETPWVTLEGLHGQAL